MIFSGAPEENLFSFSRAKKLPIFFALWPCVTPSCASVVISPPLTLDSLAFLSEGPCDYTEPDQMIRDNLPISRALITSAKSLLSCEVTSSQVPRVETWTSLGAIVLHIPGNNNILESVILDPQIAPCFWVVLAPYFCWNCGNEMVLQSF